MTSIFLPSSQWSSASTQISYAVKFNMADKVHRLSLAASNQRTVRHFGLTFNLISYTLVTSQEE